MNPDNVVPESTANWLDRHSAVIIVLLLFAFSGICGLAAYASTSGKLAYTAYVAALIGAPAAVLTAFILIAYWLRKNNSLRTSIVWLLALVFFTALVWFFVAGFFGVLYMDSMFGAFGKTVEVRRQWLLLERLIMLPLYPAGVFPQLESWFQSVFSIPTAMLVFAALLFCLGLLVFILARFQTIGLVASLIIGLLPVALIAALTLDPGNYTLSKLVPEATGIAQYPGSKVTTIDDTYGLYGRYKVTFETDATPDDVLAFYKSELVKGGWTFSDTESTATRLVFALPLQDGVSSVNKRLTVDASYRWFSLELQHISDQE